MGCAGIYNIVLDRRNASGFFTFQNARSNQYSSGVTVGHHNVSLFKTGSDQFNR
jgi:hypothetical protein